jgi:hypothetical protein
VLEREADVQAPATHDLSPMFCLRHAPTLRAQRVSDHHPLGVTSAAPDGQILATLGGLS